MKAPEWFRNSDWTPEIETHFFQKLSRARVKFQYLRIQGCYLTEKHPAVALTLLEKYFALGENFDLAQAHVDQANAYLTLGQFKKARDSLKAALAREREFPNARTSAWLEFAMLVAAREIRSHFDEALDLLLQKKSQMLFPVDKFRWHAACALITAALNDHVTAREHALSALEAGKLDHSGFRYHPKIGLVGPELAPIRQRLLELSKLRT
jgi:tetratricopeptide (TPR) repeat protein